MSAFRLRPAFFAVVFSTAVLLAPSARAGDGSAELSVPAGPRASAPLRSDEHAEAPPLLVRAGRLIVRPGEELTDVSILVEKGRIVAVGKDLTAPEGALVQEAAVVCAAFFDAWSTLGLEASSVAETKASPETRTLDAWNPYSEGEDRSEAVRGGVTVARVQAAGSTQLGGVGSVVRIAPALTDAVVVADACISASVGVTRGGRQTDIFDRVGEVDQIVGQLERARGYRKDWLSYRTELAAWEKDIAEKAAKFEEDFKKAKKKRDKEVEEAKEKGKEFKEERYKEDKKPRQPKYDADMESLARAVFGEVALVVEVHRAEEIRALLAKTAAFDEVRLVLAGATEAAHLAEELAERDVRVICWPTPLGAARPDEWDAHELSLAGALAEAGVEVLIGSGGGPNARQLRLLAALAVSHGLSRDAALAAITTAPALAFDAGARLGSVERGKEADLVLLDGDPLDTTSHVLAVVSGGRIVQP